MVYVCAIYLCSCCFSQDYREDDKVCEKLYSDPNMFFEIWKEDFIKKMDSEKKKRQAEKMRKDKVKPKPPREIVRPRPKIETHRVRSPLYSVLIKHSF